MASISVSARARPGGVGRGARAREGRSTTVQPNTSLTLVLWYIEQMRYPREAPQRNLFCVATNLPSPSLNPQNPQINLGKGP
eukprot:2921917-Prymnesium_polylepis.1